ncbi:MAG TPA: hypothetical protein VF226_13250 [Hyphomicrobiaceae bacterium]
MAPIGAFRLGDNRIAISASIGDYVSLHDVIAEARADIVDDVLTLEQMVRAALVLEEQRDLGTAPG